MNLLKFKKMNTTNYTCGMALVSKNQLTLKHGKR
jgi:hypothetical protein